MAPLPSRKWRLSCTALAGRLLRGKSQVCNSCVSVTHDVLVRLDFGGPRSGEAATVHRVRAGPGRSGAFADAWSRLPERWAVALWRVEPDLERDRDSHQHATQHNDLGRCHCPWPCEPSYYPTRRVTSSPDNDSTIAAVRPPVTARNTSSLVV